MATSISSGTCPKRVPKGQAKKYSFCLLYDTAAAKEKLSGLSIATFNLNLGDQMSAASSEETSTGPDPSIPDISDLTVSEKMSCNFCNTEFTSKKEQKEHYRSDWHRYNLKQRIKGDNLVTVDEFELIAGNISSLSGSDSDLDSLSDIDTDGSQEPKSRKKQFRIPSHLWMSGYSSTDSDSECSTNRVEEAARKLSKVYFRNSAGELISLYRCILSHRKMYPRTNTELIPLVASLPDHMTWSVFMASGGHFAGAVFEKDKVLVHKTFHRYVVRAKRGTAQSTRDSQGNAPKSAGASLRRYNEAALIQDIQELLSSWSLQLKQCDLIFLYAPGFNRQIFFSGKNPPFQKDDTRIRMIPFQTKRPTFNEIKRVHGMLASIESYGHEADFQDFIPLSPPRTYSKEMDQLLVVLEDAMTPKQRKVWNRKIGRSPLAVDSSQQGSDNTGSQTSKTESDIKDTVAAVAIPDHVIKASNQTSSCSESELVFVKSKLSTADLKEFGGTKKPKRRKKLNRKRRPSKHQIEPDSNVCDEEKYHLKNSLYTACKMGDAESLKNLLAIFNRPFNPNLSADFSIPRSNSPKDNNKNYHDNMAVKHDSTSSEFQSTVQSYVDYDCDDIVDDTTTDDVSNDVKTTPIRKPLSKKCEGGKESVDTEVVTHSSSSKTSDNTESLQVSNDIIISKLDEFTIDNSEPQFPVPVDIRKENKENDTLEIHSDLNDGRESSVGECTNSQHQDGNQIEIHKDEIQNSESHREEIETSTDGPFGIIAGKEQFAISQSQTVLELPSPVVTESILNELIGDNEITLLHVAAKEGHKGIICMLLEAGADPTIRDKMGQTPYMVCPNKETRNEFRRFQGNYPEKYDYVKAQIPAPLTSEMESKRRQKDAERKRVQKKAKQEQLKVKKAEEAKARAEEMEKQRYMALSKREKRALAAEKRLISQVERDGGTKPVLSRCWQCGKDITGMLPFEYFDYKFCSPKCLQAHRKQQVTKS
ncbi:hypothetical protein ACJMK2_023523 [Sinanodonta woodiana]|uniref:VLRF1 domain-containing protein n=1 Tax=Sinanodonta woodiana TaxID=1069815 RepID=A0ABD3T5C2_SINWO